MILSFPLSAVATTSEDAFAPWLVFCMFNCKELFISPFPDITLKEVGDGCQTYNASGLAVVALSWIIITVLDPDWY